MMWHLSLLERTLLNLPLLVTLHWFPDDVCIKFKYFVCEVCVYVKFLTHPIFSLTVTIMSYLVYVLCLVACGISEKNQKMNQNHKLVICTFIVKDRMAYELSTSAASHSITRAFMLIFNLELIA